MHSNHLRNTRPRRQRTNAGEVGDVDDDDDVVLKRALFAKDIILLGVDIKWQGFHLLQELLPATLTLLGKWCTLLDNDDTVVVRYTKQSGGNRQM
jgi:hypothetical protein